MRTQSPRSGAYAIALLLLVVGFGRRVEGQDPGAAFLPLPASFAQRAGDEVSVVAVPLGARDGSSAIHSMPEAPENLRHMRWKLVGQQLFSVLLTR